MVQGITKAKGIPIVRMGKAARFWRGEKGLIVWKRSVPLYQEVIFGLFYLVAQT